MSGKEPREPVVPDENSLVAERLRKLKELKEAGINPYPYRYDVSHSLEAVRAEFTGLEPHTDTGKDVCVAGRIMTMRKMGKASFMTLYENGVKLQVYVREDEVGADAYSLLKKLDLGDFVGVKGAVFTTKTGELSVRTKSFELLTKTIRPLPEKYHGLKDPELRYRQRYLDLVMNPETRQGFIIRQQLIDAFREFFVQKGFFEAQTPILQPVYGGGAARPFTTFHNTLKTTMYLRISNELYLKRLIMGGFTGVFEFSTDFRNEGVDKTHNPEFTQVEAYWAYKDYTDMMSLVEEIIEFAAMKIHGTTKLPFQGNVIDVKAPWKRLRMKDALKEFAQIDFDESKLDEYIKKYSLNIAGISSPGKVMQALFEELCEDNLVQPIHIIDHPVESTPLCKEKRDGEKGIIERFESYINTWEIANAYSELNDPIRQRELFEQQVKEKEEGDDEAHPMDEAFITAMEYGMPPTGGVGLGVDRLAMVFANVPSIRDVLLFPLLKNATDEE
ncbi:MAG: lysine--tRNA ligase [Candidatus Woesearchaeota archaeon]|nr:MAG: lysine--tRNA ligase [Candidatus Woesearchaeota archaeon]